MRNISIFSQFEPRLTFSIYLLPWAKLFCSYRERCVFASLFLNLLLFRQAGTQHVNQTPISDTHSSARLIYMIPLNVAAPLIFYTDMYSVSFTIQGVEATCHKGK